MKVDKDIQIAELLSKQLLGELSESERNTVDAWMCDESNKALYQSIRQDILKGAYKHQYDQLQIDENWKQDLEQQFRRISIRRFMKVAAIITMILTTGTLLYFLLPNNAGVENKLASVTIIAPGTAKAELILADGTKVGLTDEEKVIEQKGIRLENVTGKLKYKQQASSKLSPMINTLQIPRGGEYQLQLADGTKVWLNSLTKLRYPVAFTGDERKVYLDEGEAYFEVAHDASHPFIVATGKGMQLEVLGTSFNMMAYGNEGEIQTTLVEGSVELSLTNQQKVRIKPGEQASFDKSDMQIKVSQVDVDAYIAWKNGRFAFEQAELQSIMTTLSRWYDVDIFYQNESIKKKRLSANLKRYDSIYSILELFEQASSIYFEVDGRTILIKEGNMKQ